MQNNNKKLANNFALRTLNYFQISSNLFFSLFVVIRGGASAAGVVTMVFLAISEFHDENLSHSKF
jgi:hypothetical protein